MNTQSEWKKDEEIDEAQDTSPLLEQPKLVGEKSFHEKNVEEMIESDPPKIDQQPTKSTTERKVLNNNVSPLIIGGVVTFYFVISIATVFFNKYIFNESTYSFNFPLAVTWFQLVIALLCIVVTYPMTITSRNPFLKEFDSVLRKKNELLAPYFSYLPELEFDLQVVKQIWPLTAVYLLMLIFNNYTLATVNVVYYQIARSLSIIWGAVFQYYFLGITTSVPCILSMIGVFFGYSVGAIGGFKPPSSEQNPEEEFKKMALGLFYGFLSSVFVALYGIFTKSKLKVVGNNHWILLIYNTALAVVAIFPLIIIFGEGREIMKCAFLHKFGFWGPMLITAMLGYMINIAMFLQINYTTPLTNNISGTAKACVQTVLSYFVFNTDMTLLSIIGVTLCIIGSGVYALIKQMENNAEKAKKEVKQ